MHDLPRISFSGSNAAQDALHVPQLTQVYLRFLQGFGILNEVLDDIVSRVQLLQVHDGHGQPLAQHAGAHGTGAFVQGLHQGDAIGPRRTLEYFQITQGELIHPHKLGLVYAADSTDIPEAHVLGLFQIHQQGAGAADAQRIGFHGKALEAVHSQLALEALHGGIVHEGPLVDGGGKNVSQALAQSLFIPALHHQFLGFEGADQGGDIVQGTLGHLELAGAHIQEGGAALVLFHREAAEVVVLLGIQHVLAKGDARRNNLRYTAFDKFLGKFRVLQLVADGHLKTGPHKFGKVVLQGMVWESGHGHGALVPIGLFGLHQAQYPNGRNGIVRVALVEVSHAVQQQGFGVLCLHLEVMLEHGGIFRYLCHIGVCESQKYEKNQYLCVPKH